MYSRFDHEWPVIPQPPEGNGQRPERGDREPSTWAIGLLIALVVVLIAIAAVISTPA